MAVIDNTIEWLRNSGIYNRQIGGFYAYYDLRKLRLAPYIYCEITAYGIKLFINLYRWTNDPDFLVEATNMADFLLSVQYKENAFPLAYYPRENKSSKEFYSFDTAVCLAALVDLYVEINVKKYLRAAMAAGDWLVDEAQNSDGSFRCMYDNNVQRFKSVNKWFGERGALYAKNAIGLLKLYNVTNEEKYRDSAVKVCNWVIKNLQTKSGAFRVNPKHSTIFTHSHCYAVEGLLYAYHILRYSEYLEVALKAGRWLIESQQKNGALLERYGVLAVTRVFRSDATAQAIRIWSMLNQTVGDEKFLSIAKSLNFLSNMQCRRRDDLRGCGGFYNQLSQFTLYRSLNPRLYAWVSMFALHAFSITKRLKFERLKGRIVDELF